MALVITLDPRDEQDVIVTRPAPGSSPAASSAAARMVIQAQPDPHNTSRIRLVIDAPPELEIMRARVLLRQGIDIDEWLAGLDSPPPVARAAS